MPVGIDVDMESTRSVRMRVPQDKIEDKDFVGRGDRWVEGINNVPHFGDNK